MNGFSGTMRLAVPLVLLLVSAACGEMALGPDAGEQGNDPSAVEAVLDLSSYRAGDLITVTLVNATSRHYGYNLCGRSFEKRIGNDWSAMPPELRLCTADIQLLPSGATRAGLTDLPTDFTPGTYRLVVHLVEATTGGSTPTIATSAPFTVE